ncbi:MAG: hypothetical protein JO288_11560 [Hyphomicrobiales bacterium]|nr:hypothetical protein [Hyphomicrobiales bacterium]
MGVYAAGSTQAHPVFGFSWATRIGKEILNAVTERAAVAADRSRFAALPPRYLDDVGITAAERVKALGYDEPMIDAWRAVASHL